MSGQTLPKIRYVVRSYRAYPGSPEIFEEYLSAIRYDRYQSGNTNTHNTSPNREDAFEFKTLAAAEMAAVFVGGQVVTEIDGKEVEE